MPLDLDRVLLDSVIVMLDKARAEYQDRWDQLEHGGGDLTDDIEDEMEELEAHIEPLSTAIEALEKL